jgi:hypothetical protein
VYLTSCRSVRERRYLSRGKVIILMSGSSENVQCHVELGIIKMLGFAVERGNFFKMQCNYVNLSSAGYIVSKTAFSLVLRRPVTMG